MSNNFNPTVTISLDEYESLKEELSSQQKMIESKIICSFTKTTYYGPTVKKYYVDFGDTALSELHNHALEEIEKWKEEYKRQLKKNEKYRDIDKQRIATIESLTLENDRLQKKASQSTSSPSTPWYKKIFKL